MSSVEMAASNGGGGGTLGNQVGSGMARRPTRRMKAPTCGKKFCTGIETCPAIVMLIFGFLIVLCGIGMMITGPSCNCVLAEDWWATNGQTSGGGSNSTFYDRSQWTCTECPWIFQNCDHASQEWPCGRGCVLTVGSDPRQTFCLVQTFGEVLSNQWSSFSVLQKIGLGVAVGGVALIVIGLIYSVFKGKKMLM